MAKRRAQKQVVSNVQRVAEYLKNNPDAESGEIAKNLKLKPQQVYYARNQLKNYEPVKIDKPYEVFVNCLGVTFLLCTADDVTIEGNKVTIKY